MRRLIAICASFLLATAANAQDAMLMGAGSPSSVVAAGGGSVTRQDLGTAKYQATSNNFNYTGLTITGGLTNPGLVCAVARAHASNDVEAGLALTWNGVSMSLRKTQDVGTANNAVFLFGLHNPASGLQTLNISATNIATDNFVNCVSFSNVNQTSDALAFPNPTGANSATSIPVTSAAGHIAVGVGSGSSVVGTIIGTIIISDQANGAILNVISDYVVSSGASTTVGTTTIQVNIAGMDISN